MMRAEGGLGATTNLRAAFHASFTHSLFLSPFGINSSYKTRVTASLLIPTFFHTAKHFVHATAVQEVQQPYHGAPKIRKDYYIDRKRSWEAKSALDLLRGRPHAHHHASGNALVQAHVLLPLTERPIVDANKSESKSRRG
jgi:hypothetical protein